MAKRLSHFGKLMDILEITITDLSEHLQIDKTTISKWRSGTRKLIKRSPHFNSLILYMIDKNEIMSSHPLDAIWSELNPADDSSPNLNDFLGEYLCSSTNAAYEELSHAFYTTEQLSLPVYTNYVGIDGRKQAVDSILTTAEQVSGPFTLKIMELEELDWLCRDMAYLKGIMRRIEKLALKGNHIELAFSSHYYNASFKSFIMLLDNLRFLKTVKLFFVDAYDVAGLLPRIYIVSNVCVAVGLDSMDDNIPIHTNFYSDYLNTHKYSSFFDRTIELFGTAASVTDLGNEIDLYLSTINNLQSQKNNLFYFSDYLSITTMSKDLVLEILELNHLNDEDRDRCLNYYHTLQKSALELPKSYVTTYFWNLQALEEALDYDSILEHEFSALTNLPILKSRDQYLRHLRETVKFFESNNNAHLVLRSGGYSRMRSFSWIKKNIWQLSLNAQLSAEEFQVGFESQAQTLKLINQISEQSIKICPVNKNIKKRNIEILKSLYNQAQ